MADDRKQKIKELRLKKYSYREIALKFKISYQRVHQIATGYKPPSSRKINPEELKIYTKRKRKYLGLPTSKVEMPKNFGGRDYFRELVRMRDKHTCQICGKKWIKGKRRLDVHHKNEKYEGRSAEKGAIKRDKDQFNDMITLCHKCHLNLPHLKIKMSKSKLIK